MEQLRSFLYAFRGLFDLVREEGHARVHLIASLLVISAGIFFQISWNEWLAVILSIGMVFSAEAFNSALEGLSDRISYEPDEKIRRAKDISAAAVLISAIAAAAVGLVIFLPEVLELI